ARCYRISYFVDCRHRENEVIQVIQSILDLPASTPGVVIEAGSFKGGSGAKLSLGARLARRKLYLFDSFEGIPANSEEQKSISGQEALFPEGSYRGSLDQVKNAISHYGSIETCEFVKGWFDETMPGFKEAIAIAYIDVDLRASTAICFRSFYPLLVPG